MTSIFVEEHLTKIPEEKFTACDQCRFRKWDFNQGFSRCKRLPREWNGSEYEYSRVKMNCPHAEKTTDPYYTFR